MLQDLRWCSVFYHQNSKSYKWFCSDCAAIIFYYKYRFCIYPVTYTFWHSLTCITLCCKNENMSWIFIIHNTTVFFGGNLQCWKGGVFCWSIFLFNFFSIQRSLLEFRKQKNRWKQFTIGSFFTGEK